MTVEDIINAINELPVLERLELAAASTDWAAGNAQRMARDTTCCKACKIERSLEALAIAQASTVPKKYAAIVSEGQAADKVDQN